jgi:hypothetical protein
VNEILAPYSGEFFCLIHHGEHKVHRVFFALAHKKLSVLRALSGEKKEFAMTKDATTITRQRPGGLVLE